MDYKFHTSSFSKRVEFATWISGKKKKNLACYVIYPADTVAPHLHFIPSALALFFQAGIALQYTTIVSSASLHFPFPTRAIMLTLLRRSSGRSLDILNN